MRSLSTPCRPLLLTTLLLTTVCGALGAACGEPVDDDGTMTTPTGTTGPSTTGPSMEPAPTTTTPTPPTTEPAPTTTPTSPTTEPAPTTTPTSPTTEPAPTTTTPTSPTTEPAPTTTTPTSPTTEPAPEPVDTPVDVEPMTFAEVREFLDTDTGFIAPCFDCHSEGGDLPEVFKDDDTLYDTLMTRTISRCDDRALVVPGDPDNSALYLVLLGTCGTVSQMPYGCYEAEDGSENNCTSHDDRERLRLWIEAGAPQ